MANRVLIVDDAAFMRMMLKNFIEKHEDFVVVGEAQNGIEAIQKYTELNPDIVTLDITMPEMDGLEALKKIKEVNSDAIVVMCSAMGQQSMVLEAIKNGAKDFVVKPFKEDRVIEALRKAMNQ